MNRVLNFAVVAISAVIMTSSRVDAAVVNITEGSTSGYTMTDGNTYVIQNSVSFSNSTVGGSGMAVADGATVVLYVPAGVTLTATGANGSGRIGGGAGIRVPEMATLIITGEGMINATGGNAGDGGDGENGKSGELRGPPQYSTSSVPSTCMSGMGGYGGFGGGGAGAAIGGEGGIGGDSVDGASSVSWTDNCNGNAGNNGCSGTVSDSMGNVCILGSISVAARGGVSGIGGKAGAFANRKYLWVNPGWQWSCGGGGGGGGSSPMCPIGAGGQSGGGGGGGGSGAIRHRAWGQSDSGINPHGGGGNGGLSGSSDGQNGEAAEKDGTAVGGAGGLGGDVGTEGGAGTLYVSAMATVSVEREKMTVATHPAAQYTVTLDANGGEFQSSIEPIVVTLGCELPENIPTPHKGVSRFAGWSYNRDGGSVMDSNIYAMPSNVTLYAVWEPLYPVFTPESGTVFEDSLSVSISCLAEGVIIYYTTDGSEPTVDSPVYRRFRIDGKTTVKAIAEEDGLLSEVVTAEYALGQCDNPVITPSDGYCFDGDSQLVSINKRGEEGVLRYTTDGSVPTQESPVYEGPFVINASTIVKAKVFSDKFFDSAVVTVNIIRSWDVAKPEIEAANSFTGSKTKVVISCATDGATVRYTIDGSEPNSHSTKYTGPFYVTDSCMIKAYAGKYDYRDSAVVTHSIEKVWGIGDTLGKPDHGFTTDGSDGVGWVKVDDTTAPNGEAMKSGGITHNQSSVLSTTVMGPGKLTFSWRTSCEDSGGQYDWDHAEFAVDGTVLLKRDGISSWAEETVRINGDGEHTVTWTYKKDDVEKDGDDAAYLAGYGWVSEYTETKTTAVPIPYTWLLQNDPEIVDEFDAYEAAANATAANGHNKIWECYVAGISPTNETAKFAAKIDMKDGAPVVTWEPNLNTNGTVRIYKVYGSETLENGGDWQYPTNSLHKFFKVTVEMP